MADQLVDFLRGRKERASLSETDWEAKRVAWVEAVKSLYQLVQEMLRDSIAANDVSVRTFDVEVTEDFIGTYSVPVLELTVGGERLEFRPKGVTVIGAEGRVDIRGARDTVTLLRTSDKTSSQWAVVVQRIPHLNLMPLDRETLKYAFEQVMLP